MKKKLSIAFYAIIALVFNAMPVVAAPDNVTLTVHYQRPGGDYNGWNLWLWKNSDNNSLDTPISQTGVQFTGNDDFGKVVTVKIDGMKNFKDVGIIVRSMIGQPKTSMMTASSLSLIPTATPKSGWYKTKKLFSQRNLRLK